MTIMTFKAHNKKKILDGTKTSTIRPFLNTDGKGLRKIPLPGDILQVYIGSRFDSDYHMICEIEVYRTIPIRILSVSEGHSIFTGDEENWSKDIRSHPPTPYRLNDMNKEILVADEGFDAVSELIEFLMPDPRQIFYGWQVLFTVK